MRNALRMIAAVLAAIPLLITKAVWEGGKWVLRHFREEKPPYVPLQGPAPDLPVDAPASATATDIAQIRMLAALMMDGEAIEPDHLDGLGDLTMRWLCCMDEWMLEKLHSASDAEIDAHMRGQRTIRGVLRYEAGAIDDLERANAAEHERKVSELIRVDIRPDYYDAYA